MAMVADSHEGICELLQSSSFSPAGPRRDGLTYCLLSKLQRMVLLPTARIWSSGGLVDDCISATDDHAYIDAGRHTAGAVGPRPHRLWWARKWQVIPFGGELVVARDSTAQENEDGYCL